jgi:tetratricopeptide (TPR) repeat protein
VKLLAPVVVIAAMIGIFVDPLAPAAAAPGQSPPETTWSPPLDEAHYLFYSGRYEEAAAIALDIRIKDAVNLEASELRTSALHFRIRRALGEPKDRGKAWKLCALCQELVPVFMEEFTLGRAAARAAVENDPADDDALFFLGKLDLNYVWLQLATVGRKTGLGEFREARDSLETVLERRPDHIRAQVARAWIDYIVATSLPRGTRWILGGGNKDRGLLTVENAAQADTTRFARAEAMFAVWDMRAREKNFTEALGTARALLRDFPDNRELVRFIVRHEGGDG